ncbi:hypothetical protein GCM10027267_18300 [Paramicrobacterium agarici]
MNDADARDDSRAGCLIVVEVVTGEGSYIKKWTPFVEQAIDAVTRQQLSAVGVSRSRTFAATPARGFQSFGEFLHE